MRVVDRRRFLQLAGGGVAATMLSGSIARALAIPANRSTGTLGDVEHIVVLMQENRSFDHYFGVMRGARGFGDPHPAVLPSGKPVWYQADGATVVPPFRPDVSNLGLTFIEDLDHGWNGTHEMFNGGNWDKWLPAKTTTSMAHLRRSDLPYHYALADAFTLCDGYHCAMLGPTDPNRYYMWTGWDGNDGQGGGPVIANDEIGYGWQTYPERLQAAGVSWKIYQDKGAGLDAAHYWGWGSNPYIGNYGDNSLLYFLQYQNASPGSPLYQGARTGTDVSKGGGLFDILAADVASGQLPSVSWIVAPEAYTEHPAWPGGYGAWYTAGALNALTSNPEVWSKTALLVCFDENDGFFDHLVSPYPNVGGLAGQSTVPLDNELFTGKAGTPGGSDGVVGPYGLGVRVPLIVVSPWSTGGWVCSETFDHTSLIRLIEARFGVDEPNITPWRRAVCGDLTSAFDFENASDQVPPLPSVASDKPTGTSSPPTYVPTPPASGSVPVQEPGVRPSRRLGYRFDVAFDAAPPDAPSRGREQRQARSSPPSAIADRPRRALQLHDRRRRPAHRRAAQSRRLRSQPPRPERLLPPLRRLCRDPSAGRDAPRRAARQAQAPAHRPPWRRRPWRRGADRRRRRRRRRIRPRRPRRGARDARDHHRHAPLRRLVRHRADDAQ